MKKKTIKTCQLLLIVLVGVIPIVVLVTLLSLLTGLPGGGSIKAPSNTTDEDNHDTMSWQAVQYAVE